MLKIFLQRRETVCKCAQIMASYAFTSHVCPYSRALFSDAGRGDDDEMLGQREGDGDDGRVMEQDLVEGSVATAAAAALASAATKAKVKPVLPLLVQCLFVFCVAEKCSCPHGQHSCYF